MYNMIIKHIGTGARYKRKMDGNAPNRRDPHRKEWYVMEKKKEAGKRNPKDILKEIHSIYMEMLSEVTTVEKCRELADEIMKRRKPDGSFSAIDDYNIGQEVLIDFAFVPTYRCTAALVAAELKGIINDETHKALLDGLKYAATASGFAGHGYDATFDLLEAIDIYKDAGIYHWLKLHEDEAPEFRQMLHDRILEMKQALDEGRTFSGWNKDFKNEFTTEVEDFERESGWKILIVRLGERERYGLYKSFVDIPVEDQYN